MEIMGGGAKWQYHGVMRDRSLKAVVLSIPTIRTQSTSNCHQQGQLKGEEGDALTETRADVVSSQ